PPAFNARHQTLRDPGPARPWPLTWPLRSRSAEECLMRRPVVFASLLFTFSWIACTSTEMPMGPLTRAESSGFKATSRHQDVLDFIAALGPLTADMRVTSMGKSSAGQ